jgi:protein-tyrosine-phosphatase
MSMRIFNTLFLCTGNSARSVMAEALLNHLGKGRFRGFSAGSHPAGEINPLTLETLRTARIPLPADLRSKSWDEFARRGAPAMDFVITVCDRAAGEVCPSWPGQPLTAHWSFPDPVAARGTEAERRATFYDVLRQIRRRIELLLSLPVASLDRLALKRELEAIARKTGAPQGAE